MSAQTKTLSVQIIKQCVNVDSYNFQIPNSYLGVIFLG